MQARQEKRAAAAAAQAARDKAAAAALMSEMESLTSQEDPELSAMNALLAKDVAEVFAADVGPTREKLEAKRKAVVASVKAVGAVLCVEGAGRAECNGYYRKGGTNWTGKPQYCHVEHSGTTIYDDDEYWIIGGYYRAYINRKDSARPPGVGWEYIRDYYNMAYTQRAPWLLWL